VEKERGITVKAQHASMAYAGHLLQRLLYIIDQEPRDEISDYLLRKMVTVDDDAL
jgi:hypothetical protein